MANESNIASLPPTPICDELIQHCKKVLLQYEEGAIISTEAVMSIFNAYAQNSDELQQEYDMLDKILFPSKEG